MLFVVCSSAIMHVSQVSLRIESNGSGVKTNFYFHLHLLSSSPPPPPLLLRYFILFLGCTQFFLDARYILQVEDPVPSTRVADPFRNPADQRKVYISSRGVHCDPRETSRNSTPGHPASEVWCLAVVHSGAAPAAETDTQGAPLDHSLPPCHKWPIHRNQTSCMQIDALRPTSQEPGHRTGCKGNRSVQNRLLCISRTESSETGS